MGDFCCVPAVFLLCFCGVSETFQVYCNNDYIMHFSHTTRPGCTTTPNINTPILAQITTPIAAHNAVSHTRTASRHHRSRARNPLAFARFRNTKARSLGGLLARSLDQSTSESYHAVARNRQTYTRTASRHHRSRARNPLALNRLRGTKAHSLGGLRARSLDQSTSESYHAVARSREHSAFVCNYTHRDHIPTTYKTHPKIAGLSSICVIKRCSRPADYYVIDGGPAARRVGFLNR